MEDEAEVRAAPRGRGACLADRLQLQVPEALHRPDHQPLDQDRVCALIRKQCAFVFKREEDGVWRLIDFRGDLDLLGGRRRS